MLLLRERRRRHASRKEALVPQLVQSVDGGLRDGEVGAAHIQVLLRQAVARRVRQRKAHVQRDASNVLAGPNSSIHIVHSGPELQLVAIGRAPLVAFFIQWAGRQQQLRAAAVGGGQAPGKVLGGRVVVVCCWRRGGPRCGCWPKLIATACVLQERGNLSARGWLHQLSQDAWNAPARRAPRLMCRRTVVQGSTPRLSSCATASACPSSGSYTVSPTARSATALELRAWGIRWREPAGVQLLFTQ